MPVVVGTGATVLAIPVYIILKELMDVSGIALASTISIAGYTVVLGVIWLDRTGTHVLRGVARTTGRAIVPAIIAGGAAWLTSHAVREVATGFVGAVLQLVVGCLTTAVVFIALAGWMGTVRKISDQ